MTIKQYIMKKTLMLKNKKITKEHNKIVQESIQTKERIEMLNHQKKSDLMIIGKKNNLNFSMSMTKQEMIEKITEVK